MVDHRRLTVRVHEGPEPTVVYLPGLHGDWGLIGAFRRALGGRVRFVEFSYPPDADWNLDDYAAAVVTELSARGIGHGWVLGQSFGSQVAWALSRRKDFSFDGLILAGGFVRHPWPWGARFMRAVLSRVPAALLRWPMRLYVEAGAVFMRRNPQTVAELRDFVMKRSDADWAAAARRLTLVVGSRPEDAARALACPVHYLGGFVDPLVPWPLVDAWLRRHCRDYRGKRILLFAGHNVLGSAPESSAACVLGWLGAV